MLAVGEHTLGDLDDRTLKMTTGFAGGIGLTHQDLCGALSAGIMIIGAQHGRIRPDVDDRLCQALAARYRDRFVQAFGTTCCQELRQRHKSCALLVEQAVQILLEVLESEDHSEDPMP